MYFKLFSRNGIVNEFDVYLKNLNSVGKNSLLYKNSPQSEIMSTYTYAASYPLIKKNIQLQLDAGAEIVMIFDSGLADLDSDLFKKKYDQIFWVVSFNHNFNYISKSKPSGYYKNQEKDKINTHTFSFVFYYI